MSLRITRQMVEALGNSEGALRVTRQIIEVLALKVPEPASNTLTFSQVVSFVAIRKRPLIKHWARWIYASMLQHFSDELNADGINLFIEGTDRDPTALGEEYAEYRMDGPRFRLLQGNEYRVWTSVNILFSVAMNDDDFHRKHKIAGCIAEAFKTTIPLYKYGDGEEDDSSQFGCMVLEDRPRGVQVNHFGQIEEELRLEQGTVEGHYIAYITDFKIK